MKLFSLLAFLVLIPFTAHAQTRITTEESNAYYNSCKEKQASQSFSAQSQDAFCACTAAHMSQYLSKEDVAAMGSSNAAIARPAYNKMIIVVYAPCMELPTYEHYYNTCISNPDTVKYGEPDKICSCMSSHIAAHMKTNGSAVFDRLLKANPDLMDPMAALLGDPEFENFANSQLTTCLK